MPRQMTTPMAAAIQAKLVRPALLIMATFASETAYLWTGLGDLAWGGQTWKGLGSFLRLAPIEDGATVEARGTAITVSGLDASLLAEALGDFQLGLPAIVRLGLFDASGALLADPIISWSGRMDQPVVSVDGRTATITINCENRLIDMNVPADRRLTQQDMQMEHPGDLGLSFVTGVQEITLVWGTALATPNI